MVAQPVKPSTSISTHAPAGGATSNSSRPVPHRKRFLLTPLREGRRDRRAVHLHGDGISTHAPAGGASRRTPIP